MTMHKKHDRIAELTAQLEDAQRMARAEREARATHICAVCEAQWVDNSVYGDGETWSLASEDCGKCCDNDRMDRPNIIPKAWYARLRGACLTTDGVLVMPGDVVYIYDPDLDDEKKVRAGRFNSDGELRCDDGYQWNTCYSRREGAEAAKAKEQDDE